LFHFHKDGSFNVLIFPSQNIKADISKTFISFPQIENYLQLSKAEILSQIFDITVSNRLTDSSSAFDNLSKLFTLDVKTKQSNKPVKDNLTGWGIKPDTIPKMVSIGNVIVLLNKLYYKSILSVKDKKIIISMVFQR
jgi:hypothetical protein